MKKTLASIPYYWSKNEIQSFYALAVESDFDVIYLGETVCSKRHELRWPDWLQLARDLRESGKQVVLSSLTLIESSADWRQLEKLCANGEFWIEANDIGAVQLCSEQQWPFVTGSGINSYNRLTLQRFATLGCRRAVLPFDLAKPALAALITQCRDLAIEFELQVSGPLALAYSARCFTARHYDLPKDDCQFRCREHPQGLTLFSREQQQFLTINGIQTQSGQRLNLTDKLSELAAIGVTHARYVPYSLSQLPDIVEHDHTALVCNGFWSGLAGMVRIS